MREQEVMQNLEMNAQAIDQVVKSQKRRLVDQTLVERFDSLSEREQELLAKKNGLPVEIIRKMLDDPTNSKTPI